MINILKIKNKIMKDSDYKCIEIIMYLKDYTVLDYKGLRLKFNLLKFYSCDMVKFYNRTNKEEIFCASGYFNTALEFFGKISEIRILLRENNDYTWKIYREELNEN